MMKDGALLLLCGLACAFGAWAVFHFLGDDSLIAILCMALIVTAIDNMRLRRRLRDVDAIRGK